MELTSLNDTYFDSNRPIVILCAGFSVDIWMQTEEFKQVMAKNPIVIATNGAISYQPPDFQICGDIPAVKYWETHKNNTNKVIWVAKNKHFQGNFINRNTIYEAGKWIGAGTEAFNLARYLWHWEQDRSVYYTGLDFGDIVLCKKPQKQKEKYNIEKNRVDDRIQQMNVDRRYCYNSTFEVMPYQKSIQLPKNWLEYDFQISCSYNPNYYLQFKDFAKYHNDPFLQKLNCRSVCDISMIDLKKPNMGFDEMKKNFEEKINETIV